MDEYTELEMVDTGDSKASMIDKIKFLIKSRGKIIKKLILVYMQKL